MPLGSKTSKAQVLGTICALKNYTNDGQDTIKAAQSKDVIINVLLDYLDDKDFAQAIWKTGMNILSLRLEELVDKNRPF